MIDINAAVERATAEMQKTFYEEVVRQALIEAITDIERKHARTQSDTLANPNALFLHNFYRRRAGLDRLRIDDLPAWDSLKRDYETRPYPLTPRTK